MTGAAHKTVLVTGASSGIGAAIARRAAKDGWRVLAGYATGRDRAAGVVAEIGAQGGTAVPIHLPLQDPAAVAVTIETLVADKLQPEALVLNASPRLTTGPFTKVTADEFRRQLDVAIVGNHALIAGLWKHCFRKQRQGHIVALLTSALGPPPTPQMTPYIVAKAGLRALLQCACAEFGRAGLRVSTLSPGFTETPMLDEFSDLLLEMARSQTENGRFLDPDEVAAAVVDALAAPPSAGEIVEIPIRMGCKQ
jgi:3-oxoacyl-[acyl-carrier protein] reductase